MNFRTATACIVFCLVGPFHSASAGMLPPEVSKLVSAVITNNEAQARAALAAGADVNADTGEGRTPLIVAAMASRPQMVKLLLDKGADPSRRARDPIIGNALTAAFWGENGAQLTGHATPDASKHAAALEVLKLLAARKQDLNLPVRRGARQMTALAIAKEAGATDAVTILLGAGAAP
jgi:ankyrin repeat protein